MASGHIVIRIPVKSKDDRKLSMLAFLLPSLLALIGIKTKAEIGFEPDMPEED